MDSSSRMSSKGEAGVQETIKSVLDGYADAQCNLASNEARALLAKDINDALALREIIALAKDERQREHDANFGKVPTAAVRFLAGDK